MVACQPDSGKAALVFNVQTRVAVGFMSAVNFLAATGCPIPLGWDWTLQPCKSKPTNLWLPEPPKGSALLGWSVIIMNRIFSETTYRPEN